MKFRFILSVMASLIFLTHVSNGYAQDASGFAPLKSRAVKVETPHPDLDVRIMGCVLDGNKAVVECMIVNTSGKDIKMQFKNNGDAFDERGNVYSSMKIRVGDYTTYSIVPFPSEIPLKCLVEIEGVDKYATLFKRVDIKFYSRELGIVSTASNKNPIKIHNLKIDNRNL